MFFSFLFKNIFLKFLNDFPIIVGNVCPAIWDGLLCWLPSIADTLQKQLCPNYINGFNTEVIF